MLGYKEGSICGCGTKKDAMDVALKLVEEMMEKDCNLWAMQVLTACSHIRIAMSQGFTLAPLQHPDTLGLLLEFDQEFRTTSKEFSERLGKILQRVASQSLAGGIPDNGLADAITKAKEKG